MRESNNNSVAEVLQIALPAAGEMTAYTLMSIFDTMMIGNYGGNISLSAVGLCNEITISIVNIFISYGISIGITSFSARSIGAKKNSLAEEYATIGLSIGIIIAALVALLLNINSKEMLALAGAKDIVLMKSTSYLRIFSSAMFLSMAVNLMNALLRGYGNTFTPFIVSIIIAATKILFDVCLIFGHITPELGIDGSAIASIIAELSGTVYLILYIKEESFIKLNIKYITNLNLKRFGELIKFSLPSTMEEAAYSISRLLGTFMVMYAGTTGFAANEVANTVESISIMPALGFGVAATTLVGIKIGERNDGQAKRYTYSCTYWAVLISIIFSAVFFMFPYILVDAFILDTEKEALRLGAMCLAVGALEQPTIAISYVMSGALKGAGDTKSPFYISLFTSWAIRLPLIFYFIYVMKRSVVYVWWITALQWGVDALIMYLSFKHLFRRRGFRYVP